MKCPACGSTKVIPIQYGEHSHRAIKREMEGKVILRGCDFTEDFPRWYCPACKKDFKDKEVTK